MPTASLDAALLSVIVPTYKRRDLTLSAVESVLTQESPWRVEAIVAIDGSPDDTAAALRQRYGGDARVRVLELPHAGASAARNAGFAAARGEFVCFLDSDDHWLPGTLAVFAAIFAAEPSLAFASVDGCSIARPDFPTIAHLVAHDSPGWTHARFATLAPPAATVPPGCAPDVRFLRGDFFAPILFGDLFYLSAMVMRRDAVAAAGPFTERFRFFNDWEFFARLCLQGPGAYLDHDGFRRDTGRPDQISRRRPATAMPRRHLYILRSLPRRFPARAAAYTAVLRAALDDAQYVMGRALLGSRHRRWARRYLLNCFKHGYKRARCFALLTASFLRK
jgi:glycosyltransferase involved in cell wall biosynthesis